VPDTKTCFVIGPIGEEGSSARNAADILLRYVIKAGLEPGYGVTRADEISRPGMINDQVITSIKEADLIVADLHGENPNAFYEVAIAHCFRKPTIHMIAKGAKIPFDLHEYRTIHYDLANPAAHDQAREELNRHASALDKPDVAISNPVTRALGTFELEQSGDARDRWIAELGGTVQRLASDLQNVSANTSALLLAIEWFISSLRAGRELDLPLQGFAQLSSSLPRGFMSRLLQEPTASVAEARETTPGGPRVSDQ
jgi:hypothetical protein